MTPSRPTPMMEYKYVAASAIAGYVAPFGLDDDWCVEPELALHHVQWGLAGGYEGVLL
jgi:hypothetical protein